MLLSPGKTPSNCLLLPPRSLRMGVRMSLRSWLGRLIWCRRIVLPRPGSSLFQDSAVTRCIHVQSLPSRNATAGGCAGRNLCEGLPRWRRECSLCLPRHTELQSLILLYSWHLFYISVSAEPTMPSAITVQDGIFFPVREIRQVKPTSSLLNDHCGHGFARGLNRAHLKTQINICNDTDLFPVRLTWHG